MWTRVRILTYVQVTCRHVEMWACGRAHVDLWTYGGVGTWTFGSVNIWACGPLELWTCGHVDLRKYGHVGMLT